MKRHYRFCVIGLGNFGFHVAKTLYEAGHEVVAVDLDQEKVQRILDYSSYAMVADAASKDFLAGQGVGDMDAVVVSTGERSHISALITLYLKELNVSRILVKAINEDHGKILEKVGATEVIFPEKDMAVMVARGLSTPNILEFIPLDVEYSITEASPPAHFIGQTLAELHLRKNYQVTVIGIKHSLTDKFSPVPPPDYVINGSDLLVLIGKSSNMERALKTE